VAVVCELLIPSAGCVVIYTVVVFHRIAKPVERVVLESLRMLKRPADEILDPGSILSHMGATRKLPSSSLLR
jgi:hypothetical protein